MNDNKENNSKKMEKNMRKLAKNKRETKKKDSEVESLPCSGIWKHTSL